MDGASSRVRWSVRGIMVAVAMAAGVFGAMAWLGRTRFGCTLYSYGYQAMGIGVLVPWAAWIGGAGLLIGVAAIALDRRLWRPRTLWLATPFLIPVVTLIYGIVCAYSAPTPSEIVDQRGHVLWVLFWLPLPIALALIVGHRRAWLATIGLSAAAWYWTFGASFMASMSVTGNWL